MRLWIMLPATLVLVAVLSSCCWSADAISTFPKPTYYEDYSMYQGYYGGEQAWFTCVTTNSIKGATLGRFCQSWSPMLVFYPILSSKLSQALIPNPEKAARPVYVTSNPNQGPVFSTAPGQTDYSGLWQLFCIEWHQGVVHRTITNTEPASPDNPLGMPDGSEVDITETGVVLDCPILALGPLGGPWYPGDPGRYRIPQGLEYGFGPWTRWVSLPHFSVFAEDPVTSERLIADVLIADVADENLAALIGANHAPGLVNMPDAGAQAFWVMNGPKPPTQAPVVQYVPTWSVPNLSTDYTPVMDYIALDRHVAVSTVVRTPSQVGKYLGNGRLTPSGSSFRIKAHVCYAYPPSFP